MWLLSTDSLKLVYFDRVDKIEGGYAILSHVWDDSEQSFQDIQKLRSEGVSYDSTGDGDRSDGAKQALKNAIPPISNKILGCVKTAKAHGFCWLWIDASCIDKTSSAELSEAINSMFSWYEKASVCYAYLIDVPKSCVLHSPKSAFRTSRWFSRGWTLQELIAPRCLVFMSSEWTYLGTKASLAPLLSEITGIDVEVLTFRRELRQVSVARRMSWASKRETTRVEDEAYSLMGLFGITMPTIYGEGRKAFRRLQEEIMKQSPDQSLFAWGRALRSGARRGRLARDIANPIGTLLAPSPGYFASSAGYRPIPPGRIADAVQGLIRVPPGDTLTNPDFAVTSAGIRCQLLVVDFKPFALALLACRTATGDCIGLLLHQRHDVQSDRPHYLVGAVHNDNGALPEHVAGLRSTAREAEGHRLLYIRPHTLASLLDRSIAGHGSSDMVVAERRKIYISRDLSFFPPHPWLRLLEPEPQQIYLPAWFAGQCQNIGFELKDNIPPGGNTTHLPRNIHFENELTGEAFVVHLERLHMWLCVSVSIYPCSHLAYSTHYQPRMSGPEQLPWRPRAFEEDSLSDGSHPSSLKHCVRYWPNGWKTFGDADRTVRVSCTRWTTASGDQYCLDLVLEGCVYNPHSSDSGTAPQRTHTRQAGEEMVVSSRSQRHVFARNALLAELGRSRRPYPRQNVGPRNPDARDELPRPFSNRSEIRNNGETVDAATLSELLSQSRSTSRSLLTRVVPPTLLQYLRRHFRSHQGLQVGSTISIPHSCPPSTSRSCSGPASLDESPLDRPFHFRLFSRRVPGGPSRQHRSPSGGTQFTAHDRVPGPSQTETRVRTRASWAVNNVGRWLQKLLCLSCGD